MGEEHTIFYACKYTPLELLAGFGAKAQLAEARKESFDEADRVAHQNLCGYAKGLITRLLEPDVRELVLLTCCDAIKRAYDVVLAQRKLDFCFLLDLPHRRGDLEKKIFSKQMRKLADSYAAYSGVKFDIGAALAAFRPPIPHTGCRVLLLGAHADTALLTQVGADVGLPVENATCTSERLLASPPPQLARIRTLRGCVACAEVQSDSEAARPAGQLSAPEAHWLAGSAPVDKTTADSDELDAFLEWYAGALLDQMPCMRMDDVGERACLSKAPGVAGIVYHTMKFCDYYGFEYASMVLRRGKDGGGVPMVKVETDGTSQTMGQLKTRLSAFGETLHGISSISGGRQPLPRDPLPRDPLPRDPKGSEAKTTSHLYVLGIDSGSTSTDAVIVDERGTIMSSVVIATGAKASDAATRAKTIALTDARLTEGELSFTVATGYGREAIADADTSITEITCHAYGAHCLAPDTRTVIDIGGQDSKVIHVDADGGVVSFVMNDKCAAGTGRFLEMMARALDMSLEEFCHVGLEWKHEVHISSMCTVFAESEVVSLVARDVATPDIIHGLDESVARKTLTLAKRVGAEPPYLMTGGVAANEGVVSALSEALGAKVKTHPASQLCGAIGAAMLALERLRRAPTTRDHDERKKGTA